MMKVLKLMSIVVIVWGAVAAMFLLIAHYSKDKLVVEIHWNKDRSLHERNSFLDDNSDDIPDQIAGQGENDHAPPFLSKPNVTVKPKLKELPIHTLGSMSAKCLEPYCLEHLSPNERVYYDKCRQKALSNEYKFGPISKTAQCRFQNSTNRYPVGLASFPGSGNTWVRGLLEKVTGYCTGALYCDCALRTKGFTGEGIRGPSALVIKSHGKNALFSNRKLPRRILNDAPVYGGAILLVRDPRKALIAEWHRERSKRRTNSSVSNHFLSVGKEHFGDNPQWGRYITERLERWKAHVSGWIISGKYNPFLIIRFEDLKQNTAKEVLKMVEFLGFKGVFTESSIQEKLGEGFNSFYRNHQDEFEHFTSKQKQLINITVKEAISLLEEDGMDKAFPIQDYLQT